MSKVPLPKPDLSSHLFNLQNDAFHHARLLVEDSICWVARNSLNVCESYERSELEIVFKCRSMLEMPIYHLIFRAIPNGRPFEGYDPALPRHKWRASATNLNSGSRDGFMFVGVANLVQSPQKMIPSFVWLKRNHQVKDVFRNLVGGPFWQPHTFCINQIATEREMSLVSDFPSSDSSAESCLIECGPKTSGGFECEKGERYWNGFSKLDLIKVLSTIGIMLNEFGVWVCINEGFPCGLKLFDPMLGMVDTEF